MMNLTSKTSKSFLLFKRALVLLCLVLCSLMANAGGTKWTAIYRVNIQSSTQSSGQGKVYLQSGSTKSNEVVVGVGESGDVSLSSGQKTIDISNESTYKHTFNGITLYAVASDGSIFTGWEETSNTSPISFGNETWDNSKGDVGSSWGNEDWVKPDVTPTYHPIFTAKTYHFISPSIRAVYQGESGIETGGGTVALVRDGTTESRPADEISAWQTQITGSLISAQGNGVDDGIVYEYAYYAKPNDGYVFLGWHTINGTTLTKLSGEQNYLPAEGTTATSTNASSPTQGPIMVALFKKSTIYYHTGVSVNIAGYEAEREEKGWVFADDGTYGTVESVESANAWVKSLHDKTAYPLVDQTEYKYTYYAKSSDPTKYAFKGWAKTPFGTVEYEGSETNRVLKDYVFTMTDDNTSEANAYPTPTLYAVFESFFFRCPPVAVADNSRGGGKVHVSLTPASIEDCTKEDISAGADLQQVAATSTSHKYTVYYYAKKVDGAEFVGWSTTPDGLNILPNSIGKAEYSTTYESQNKSKNAPHVAAPLYAVFRHDFDIRQQDRMIVYDDEDGNKSINDAKVLIDFQKGNTLTATLSGADASYFTLSNRSGSKKGSTITFDATQGLIEMVVAYQGDLAQAVGKKAEITLSAIYGSYIDPVERNVTIIVEEAPMITFLPTDGKGSYTIKMTNGSGINYTMSEAAKENINVQVTHESMSNLEMNITDLGGDEYRFFGWQMIDGATTTYISYDDLVNYQFTKSVKVRPEFIHNSRATYSIIGDDTNTPYHDFAQVMKVAGELAESMQVSQTVLLNDSWKGETITAGVLPKGNYTIPSGVNLLIPGDTQHTYRTNLTRDAGDFLNQSGLKSAEHIRWIVEEGTNITVQENANILVYSRIITYGNEDNGRPYQYGHIELKENCKLNFLNGSNLYVYGYITGPLSSEITMNSGTTVKEVFQVKDWRGGSATSSILLGGLFGSKKVFLIGQYYAQNIEVPLVLKKGASEILEAGISDLADMDVDFIVSNTGAGLFRMGEGTWVKKYYDPYTDRICFIGSKDEGATGEMQVNYVSIDAGIAKVSSADYVLPIPSNFDIKIQGNLTGTLLNDFAFMPGSTLTVEKGSTLKVNKRLFAYDDIYKTIDGKGYYGAGNKVLAPLTYRPGETGKEFKYKRTEADLVDAKFIIDGELICNGGEIYTTNATNQTTNHANITSNGGGKVTFGSLSGYDNKVYQIYQDGTSPSYKEVPVSPARLRHGNGYYETNPQTGTYTYVNNKWTLNASTTPNPTIPAVVDYIPRFIVSEVPEASTYVGKSTTITVSASANNTNIPTEDWANATKMTWKYELIGTDANQFSLSGAGTITFEPKSEGRKTVTLRITATYTRNVNSANTAVKYTYSKDVQLVGNASYLAANILAFVDLSTLYAGQSIPLFAMGNNTNKVIITSSNTGVAAVNTDVLWNDAIIEAKVASTDEITITATQEPDLDNNIAGTTITKKVKINNRVVWNWDVLYFGTVNKDPITILGGGTTDWTLTKIEDKSNIINYNPTTKTATIQDQIAGEYEVTFTFTQGEESHAFTSTVIADPRYLRVDVNNETTFRAITLSANDRVRYNDAGKLVMFTSTETNISQWKLKFMGVPDKICFIPNGVNTWQIEESSNGVNWTTSLPWKYLTSNVAFEWSLLPSTSYVRISYGAGNSNAATLKDVYITELTDVKADVEKLYIPVQVDTDGNVVPYTKEVVLTYANTSKLHVSTSDARIFKVKESAGTDAATDMVEIAATTEDNPFGIKGIEVVSTASRVIEDAYLNVFEGTTLVLQIPIKTYLFPQELPIKLATDKPDGGDRYYYVTTHTHNAEWNGIDGVRTITLNNAVSDAAPYLTFAFRGAPTYISFDYTNTAKGTWKIEESVDGKSWSVAGAEDGDQSADGHFKRTVGAASQYLRVIYESTYAEKVAITNLVIVGDATAVVPARLELDYNTATELTVSAINLLSMTLTTDNKNFQITHGTDDDTYTNESLTLTSAEYPAALGENVMGDVPIYVKWTGSNAIEYATLTITNPNDENKVLGVVELVGMKSSITDGNINIYTGVPADIKDGDGNVIVDVAKDYTLNGAFEGAKYRPVDISAAFSSDNKALFDYVVIYGETTTNDGSQTITTPNTMMGSNAKTPCYIYKKNGNNYKLKKIVENTNSKDKAWNMVDMLDEQEQVADNLDVDAVQIPEGKTSVSMYITGFCPYASTGYTKADEGVWYFRAGSGQSIDLYLEDCYIYSRSKTEDGHFFVDRQDGYSFSERYVCGSGAVFVFACKDKSTTPMNVTIHTLDKNLVKSHYGCFLQSIAGRAYQASSPVQIRVMDDTYVIASSTSLNFTDEWPTAVDENNVVTASQRTNGFLSLQKQVNNAPSIDMGNGNTIVNFNGGQVELQNAQIVSTNYKSSLAICPRSGEFAGVPLAFGMGTDAVGGTVNFNDGTTTVLPMYVSPNYAESYLLDKDADGNYITNSKGEFLTSCLRTPQDTYVYGGSHCMMRACSDPESQGGAPKNKSGEDGVLLGLYKYPRLDPNPADAENKTDNWGWSEITDGNGLVTPNSVPDGYGISSVTPNTNGTENPDDDYLNFWFDPDFEPTAKPEVDKIISFWKTCMTRIEAEYAGYGGKVGGDTQVEKAGDVQTEIVKYLLYCKIDENILDVISGPDYQAQVKNPAPSGDDYLPVHPSTVGDEVQHYITNSGTFQVEDKLYYITTATADVWSAFTAPFDVANIYVVETYPENELAAMESAEDGVGRTDILMAQAQHNADFASFFAVTIALKQNKTFETIYQEYISWANKRDKNLNLNQKPGYTPSGMLPLTPYNGSNWADANCYIYENKGPWLITTDNLDANTNIPTKFTTQWGFVDTSDGKLMNQGMTYSMLLPYCMGCGDDISMRDFWDYWSGKFLIFESTDGPHTIHGTDYMESIVSGLEAEESSAVLTGNSTFASIGVSEVYQYNADLQSSEFTRKSTMDLLPTESFLKPNVTTPSKIIGIRRTGEIIYDDDNNGNQNGTSGHIPTVGGGNDLFITTIEEGINVAVATPQHVRVLSSTGAVIYSGMIQTALDIPLPCVGVYVVSGENEVQKVLY